MTPVDDARLKKAIVEFAVQGVDRFLQAHPGLVFYAFAFDCHAEYAVINLCLNTEEAFSSTLGEYRIRQPDGYQSPEEVRDLRYNTGDWEYQCFDTLHVLSHEELDAAFKSMPEDDYQSWRHFVAHLLAIFAEALRDFTQTEAYRGIPKAPGFIAFCIDHDEDVDAALDRAGAG